MIPRSDHADERRLSRRVHLVAQVTLESASHLYAGLSRDLSRGGVFVATHHTVPMGTAVVVEIIVAHSHLRLPGIVRWHRAPSEDAPAGLGVAFTKLSPEQLALLATICEEREPYFYEFDED